MKGLYVYGALLMGMSFAAGVAASSTLVVALSLVACASAALSEALTEWAMATGFASRLAVPAINVTAFGSWVLTAIAALAAFLTVV